MIHLFRRVFPRTSNSKHYQQKGHFCDLRLCKRTFYESFKSFSVFTAKHKTDNRVDSTVRVNHITGDYIVYPETTREMRGNVLCN